MERVQRGRSSATTLNVRDSVKVRPNADTPLANPLTSTSSKKALISAQAFSIQCLSTVARRRRYAPSRRAWCYGTLIPLQSVFLGPIFAMSSQNVKRAFPMPQISVIVPVHNNVHTINRCISSLMNQTLFDLEVVIVLAKANLHNANLAGLKGDSNPCRKQSTR